MNPTPSYLGLSGRKGLVLGLADERSIAFGIAGFALVAIWVGLGLPPGPDVGAFYTVGAP